MYVSIIVSISLTHKPFNFSETIEEDLDSFIFVVKMLKRMINTCECGFRLK